jgi:hypothetical protein
VNSFLTEGTTIIQASTTAVGAFANRPPPLRYNLRVKPTFVRVPRLRRGPEQSEGDDDDAPSAAA